MKRGFIAAATLFVLIGLTSAASAFDVFVMGLVVGTHYDAKPEAYVDVKVIEGALDRIGQTVQVIIPEGEGLKHFKRRIKPGMELDSRVRIRPDGSYEMATAQLRAIPSREYEGAPSIEDVVKQNLKGGRFEGQKVEGAGSSTPNALSGGESEKPKAPAMSMTGDAPAK